MTLLRERGVYLWVIFLIPAVSIFGHALAPNTPFIKGQDLGIVLAIVLAAIAGALWLVYRGRPNGSPWVWWFLAIVAVAWAYQLTRTHLDGSLFNISALLVPILLLIIGLKAVSRNDLHASLLVLGYSLLAISALSLALGAIGWMPDGFRVSDSAEQRLPFMSLLGIENRWGGPFGSVNYSSPAGGLLIIIGVAQRRWNRWILIAGGSSILALGGGRTAFFAVAAALLVWALWSGWVNRSTHSRAIRVAAVSMYVAGAVAYIALLDPTVNGRSSIWGDYTPLLADDVIIGVGESGIREFVQSMSSEAGFIPFDHVHSVLLDGTVRFGIIMGILTLGIYLISLISGWRALRGGHRLPLALVVYVVVAGLAETIHSWNYWTIYLAALMWAVLASAMQPKASNGDVEKHPRSLSLPGAKAPDLA